MAIDAFETSSPLILFVYCSHSVKNTSLTLTFHQNIINITLFIGFQYFDYPSIPIEAIV